MLYEQKALPSERHDVLDKLLSKSHDFMKLNYEFSQKLKENETAVTALSDEINTLKRELDEAKSSRQNITELKHKIVVLANINKQLSKNIEVLGIDLHERESHINSLKRHIMEKRDFLFKLREKDRKVELLKKEVFELKGNTRTLRYDLDEKENHINTLRRTISKKPKIDHNEIKIISLGDDSIFLKKEIIKKNNDIKKLEQEKNILHEKISELFKNQEQDKEKHSKETRLLFNITNKLRQEMTKSSGIKGILTRNEILKEENRKLLNQNNKSKSGLMEKEEKIKLLDSQIEETKSVNDKFMITLKKLKKAMVFINKENKEFAKRLKIKGEECEDVKNTLELKNKEYGEIKAKYKKELESEKQDHKEQIKKFIKQYFRVKMFSESEIRELKKKLYAKGKEMDVLKSKIDFLKNEISEQTKKELDLKSELEILKKEKN